MTRDDQHWWPDTSLWIPMWILVWMPMWIHLWRPRDDAATSGDDEPQRRAATSGDDDQPTTATATG